MDKKALFDKKKKELYEIAKKLKVPKRSLLSKSELIKQILRVKEGIRDIITFTKKNGHKRDRDQKYSALKTQSEENLKEIIEDSKYQVTINHNYLHEDLGDLPYSYNEDKICAMVVNPHLIYIYWDLSSHTYHRITRNGKISKPYLRAANPDNEKEYFEIGISNGMQSYYLTVAEDRNYIISYGVYDKSKWCEIGRTKRCKTPPAKPSAIVENSFIYIPLKVRLKHIKELVKNKIKKSGSLGKALLDLRKEKKLPSELVPGAGFSQIDAEFLSKISQVNDKLASSIERDRYVGY